MTDHSAAASGSASARAEMLAPEASRSATASVSAGIAAANAEMHKPVERGPRFPAEDNGRSLAAMAERDLDATLQLLAERAQYITEASGAAIALRRGQHKDMLCRASAGSNAPELGALLSMEYGLSGESVRTLQILRCDDTERDARVNREGCRQLGIASVVVMPVVREEQAIGVFELFSGKPNAFSERDVSALQRLSEMVETAVRHARAMQDAAAGTPAVDLSEASQGAVVADEAVEADTVEESEMGPLPPATEPSLPPQLIATESPAEKEQSAETNARTTEVTEPEKADTGKATTASAAKPLFWSAIQRAGSAPAVPSSVEPGVIAIPAGLRNLQKCSGCGFPVSQGRTFCVECEQKKWRGEALAQPAAARVPHTEAAEQARQEVALEVAPTMVQAVDVEKIQPKSSTSEIAPSPQEDFSAPVADSAEPEAGAAAIAEVTEHDAPPAETGSFENSAPFLGAMQSESWFAANKYVLAGLLVVAVVITAIVLMR